jgi:hypothetical protein
MKLAKFKEFKAVNESQYSEKDLEQLRKLPKDLKKDVTFNNNWTVSSLGKTQTGKDIFSNKRASEYEDFTPEDHEDASDLHYKQKANLSMDHPERIFQYHHSMGVEHARRGRNYI